MGDKMQMEKPSILIVDDTPTDIQALAETLRTDFRVRMAGSGKIAFENIAEFGTPDLILLDVMMPEMDGYEVCRRLKDVPEIKDVPVIFLTATSDVVDEKYGLRLGALDYIAKPFNIPVATARVQNYINLKIRTDLLESQAMLDGLTCIPNRRRFEEGLEREWRRAQRSGTPLSLIIADIDFFKQYNDHYGHGVGDVCLKRVATALIESSDRPSDLAVRYGGEKFAAILPETDLEGARTFAERFRALVEFMDIPHEHSSISSHVTVSVGLACRIPDAETTPTGLLGYADEMLSQAKKMGRNMVCLTEFG